jgi:hypothetical protein
MLDASKTAHKGQSAFRVLDLNLASISVKVFCNVHSSKKGQSTLYIDLYINHQRGKPKAENQMSIYVNFRHVEFQTALPTKYLTLARSLQTKCV